MYRVFPTLIVLISDSTGETLGRIFLAIKSQFATFEYDKKEYVFIMISSEPNNIEAYINEIKYFINSVKTKG